MANWDFIFSYDAKAAAWLKEQGYPHPPVASGNRTLITADMKWGLGQFPQLSFEYPADDGRLYVSEGNREGAVLCISGF